MVVEERLERYKVCHPLLQLERMLQTKLLPVCSGRRPPTHSALGAEGIIGLLYSRDRASGPAVYPTVASYLLIFCFLFGVGWP